MTKVVPGIEVSDARDTDGDDLREVLGMEPRRAPVRLAVGQVIDAYQIEEELGEGGMGRVYRARDVRLARNVAIKLHAHAIATDDTSLRREATALARLAHPNVVAVYELGSWAGHPWVAMEYVHGGNARSWLAEKARTSREILAVFIAAGRGLAAAHDAGLVHRDFKPDNVLVGTDGRVRVADFGLAREVAAAPIESGAAAANPALAVGTPPPTRSRVAGGTPAYMAPEQHAGGSIGPATDQFAFGVALWEALAGTRPFAGVTEEEAAANAASGTIGRVPSQRIPAHVERALRRALASRPDDRWPSMAACLAELERDPARTRRRVALLGAAALTLTGGGWFVARMVGSSPAAVSCDLGSDELVQTWSPRTRDLVRAHLAKDVTLAERTIAVVDTWSDRWHAERRAACEGTHVEHRQSERLFDLRIACLDRARAGFAATISMLTDGELKPAQALDAAVALPRLSECADTTLLVGGVAPPSDPATIAIAHEAEVHLARARALRTSGHAKLAVEAGRLAVRFADANRRFDASARARIELAAALHASGTLDGVLETFEDAARFAAEAHDDVVEARAWMNVVDVLAVRLEKPDEADRLIRVAEAAIVRAGSSPYLEGLLAGTRGDLAFQRNNYADAVPLFEQRIATMKNAYGATDPDLARWHSRLGAALTLLHRLPEARAQFARANTILEGLYGPRHPNVGVVLTNLGELEYLAGNYAEAIELLNRALSIKTGALGESHVSLAPTLVSLARAQADSGAKTDALDTAKRAAKIAERGLPPAHPKIGLALTVLGRIAATNGAWSDAKTALERARTILEPAGDQPPFDETLRALARVLIHAGDLRGARAVAERAVAITTASHSSGIDAAAALEDLAAVQIAANEPPAARASLAHAVEIARADLGDDHPMVARLTAQLAELQVGSQP